MFEMFRNSEKESTDDELAALSYKHEKRLRDKQLENRNR